MNFDIESVRIRNKLKSILMNTKVLINLKEKQYNIALNIRFQ